MDALPVELISTIFEWAVQHASEGQDVSQRHRTAQGVSHISRRLRDVALASPLLWSTVEVSKNHPPQLARTSLERSKACPLDVTVHTGDLPSHETLPILQAIGQHVSRWSSFRLHLTEEVVHDAYLALSEALTQDEADTLESLELTAPSCRADPSAPARPILERVIAPRLQTLALRNSGLNFQMTRFPRLRELSLIGLQESSNLSIDTLSTFLQGAQDLTKIELVDITIPPSEPTDDLSIPTIPLPSLDSLVIENIPFDLLHFLLSSIVSPKLRSFRLGAHLAPHSLDWSDILTPSFGNVDEFEWTSSKEPPSDADALRVGSLYEAMLQRLVNATIVRISSVVALGRLVGMTLAGPEDAVLPRLKDLECHGMKGCGLSSLVSLVEGRATAGLGKMDRLSISARDFSTTASIGQRSLQAADAAMDALKRGVGRLELRERQDRCAFRYTFLGWKDYMAHQNGRRIEYEQEFEE